MSTNSAPQFTFKQRLELAILSTEIDRSMIEPFCKLVDYMEDATKKENVIEYLQTILDHQQLLVMTPTFLAFLKNRARMCEVCNKPETQAIYLKHAEDLNEMMSKYGLFLNSEKSATEKTKQPNVSEELEEGVTYYDPRHYALTSPPPGAKPYPKNYLAKLLSNRQENNLETVDITPNRYSGSTNLNQYSHYKFQSADMWDEDFTTIHSPKKRKKGCNIL